jgi:serine/threonine protein kinase
MLYCMLCGHFPFWGPSPDDLLWITKKGLPLTHDWPPWLSMDAKDLVCNMLAVDPKER